MSVSKHNVRIARIKHVEGILCNRDAAFNNKMTGLPNKETSVHSDESLLSAAAEEI